MYWHLGHFKPKILRRQLQNLVREIFQDEFSAFNHGGLDGRDEGPGLIR
jgi:hypothetical protein